LYIVTISENLEAVNLTGKIGLGLLASTDTAGLDANETSILAEKS
jgi:hypothetical protein